MNGTHLLAHQHGGIPAGRGGVIDFSVNVSPLPPPLPELPLSAYDLSSYPTMEGRRVREFYAGRFGLEEDRVMPLNGAIEGIYLLPRALGLKRVLIPQPSFFDYARACRLAGAEVVGLQLDAASGFASPDFETFAAALAGCDALLAGNPNNPTGTMMPKEMLQALACRFPDKTIIVDEAFIQFTDGFPGNSLMFGTGAFRNIVVVHSLTKFYALPGLRLGALVADHGTIRKIYGHKEPWTVNAVAESVARHLLGWGNYETALLDVVRRGRQLFAGALEGHDSLRLFGGTANYFLASATGIDPDKLSAHFDSQGIFVRACHNFEGLDRTFFRFAIRDVGDNLRLVEAIRTLLPLTGGSAR